MLLNLISQLNTQRHYSYHFFDERGQISNFSRTNARILGHLTHSKTKRSNVVNHAIYNSREFFFYTVIDFFKVHKFYLTSAEKIN